MFKIILKEKIDAPKEIVWNVITDIKDYPNWNQFIRECDTTFQVGSPINMKVQLLPSLSIWQKETIWRFEEGKLIDYGIKYSFGLLSSSRQHILTAIDKQITRYESLFILKGLLAPIVKVILGRQLKKGFESMTTGIMQQSLQKLKEN